MGLRSPHLGRMPAVVISLAIFLFIGLCSVESKVRKCFLCAHVALAYEKCFFCCRPPNTPKGEKINLCLEGIKKFSFCAPLFTANCGLMNFGLALIEKRKKSYQFPKV